MFTESQWLDLISLLERRTESGSLEWAVESDEEDGDSYEVLLGEMQLSLYPKIENSNLAVSERPIELTVSEKASGDDERYTKEVGGVIWEELRDTEGAQDDDQLVALYELVGRKIREPDEKFAEMVRDDKFHSLMAALSDEPTV